MKNSLNKLILLFKRLSIVFVIYQFSRIFFFLYNQHRFDEVNISDLLVMMWGGLRFDLTAILYLNVLFIILSLLPFSFTFRKGYQKFLFILFVLINSFGYAANVMDTFYFDYVLKRSTVEVFMFAQEGNIGLLFFQFIKDFWWGFIVWGIFIYITYKWYKWIQSPKIIKINPYKYFVFGSVVLLIALYFSVVGIRGGFTRTTRPININNAGAYVNKPIEMAVVLNTPFTILRTLRKQVFKPVHYFDKKTLKKFVNPVKHYTDSIPMQKSNVVIFIIESFAKEYTGLLNKDIKDYKGYTPFFDSLMQKSHTFTNAYANGRKSIDAIPSTLTSIPSLVQPYVLSPYATNDISGIGSILKKEGYKTAFFHGAPDGSMGFDAITHLAGFDEYYGMNEYGNDVDFDGHWGIPDDKFLQYTAKQLDTFKQPFAIALFTLSSHHPFMLPKGFENKFKGGPLPIHKVIQYTDFSFKHFFETVKNKEWFKNTIFVFTADHCNQTILPEYNSSVGAYANPIIFYEPGHPKSIKMDSTLMQQIDIKTRLLRKLHYSGDFVAFGNDPVTEKNPFVINYTNHTWEMIQGNYFLTFRNEKVIGLYNYKKDRLLKNNVLNEYPDAAKQMEKRMKAFIQQYKNRLIQNRLTVQ